MSPRVLFAEDDASIRESFTAILNQEGVAVTPCASATEACERLAAGDYDLVITDMRMETPTAGWSVVRAARALPHPPSVAVMTAFPIPKSDLRSSHIQILNKGMSTPGLIAKVRELVRKAVAHRAPHTKKNEGHGQMANGN